VQSLDQLELPIAIRELSRVPDGLVLVTGPTGSGKSTTLAAMIDKINRERHEHIITIEDPVEFLHQHKNCVVNQRELHADTHSFANSLKSALRQDPDVVLIGEMRDLETIESALRIAETGHLTFGTLHTNSAAQTINRIVDVFPAHQQPQIRAQLSSWKGSSARR
jgi:twitching motility protein PilT